MIGIRLKPFSDVSRKRIGTERGMFGLVNKSFLRITTKIEEYEFLVSAISNNILDDHISREDMKTYRNLKHLEQLTLGIITVPDNVDTDIPPFNEDYMRNINDFSHNNPRKNTISFKNYKCYTQRSKKDDV